MRVVNLCFHGIGVPGRRREPGEEAYWIARDLFLGVLDLVADRADVRLSFDDGNASDAEIALPALRDRGLHARFFVVTDRLDRPGSLTREDLRRLHGAGMTIGNHGMAHRPWRGLDPEGARREMVEAREVLADVTGAPVRDAALPLGHYDRRTLVRLRSLDYASVHTSDRRRARTDGWLQPRYSLRRGDTLGSVEHEVLGAPRAHVRARSALVGTIKRLR